MSPSAAAKPLQMETMMVLSPTPYDLSFDHNTARLAYHYALWPFKVIQVNDFHGIWKPICDFLLMINSNLSLISHRLATIHSWQTTTDRRHIVP